MSSLPPPVATTSSWTFTQGFLLGQASFLLLVLLFIRYVVFSPAEPIDDESWKQRRAERIKVGTLSTQDPRVLLHYLDRLHGLWDSR